MTPSCPTLRSSDVHGREGAEEGVGSWRAEMLEHAERHDAVEAPRVAQRKVAIVDEFEGHAVGESGLRRARLRQRELFLGQGDAVDGDRKSTRLNSRH